MIRLLPPAIILYTDDLPDGVGGRAYGPVVLIREKYEADVGLHEHELTHVAQFWMWVAAGIAIGAALLNTGYGPAMTSGAVIAVLSMGIHPLYYTKSSSYRLHCEVLAYREQMKFPDRTGHRLPLDEAAVMLADARYDLGLTVDDARTQLFIS